MAAAGNPAVVGERIGNDEREGSEGQRKPDEASEHGLSLSLSRRGDRLIQADGSCVPAWLQAESLHATLGANAIPWVDSPPKRWNQPLDMEV
jgi:hypothetical protein